MDNEQEKWRDVPGYGGHYQASSNGRVKSKERIVHRRNRWGGQHNSVYKERILKPHKGKDGYLTVRISVDNIKYTRSVHRMVASAWHGPCPKGMECCHGNGINDDNRPENLRWDTHLSNNRDRHNKGNYPTGERHPMNKFSDIELKIMSSMKFRDAFVRYGISNTHHRRIKKILDGPL